MLRSPTEFGMKAFEDLKPSTMTAVVYGNIQIVFRELFNNIGIHHVVAPLTSKKKNINKKELVAPEGKVVSVQNGIEFRGLRLMKPKKYWCSPNCQLLELKDGKEKKVMSVCEEVWPVEGTDKFMFKYFCTNCKQYYELQQLKEKPTFLNQLTVYLSIGDHILNMMIFKDKSKIVGCRNTNDVDKVVKLFWNIVRPHSNWFTIKTKLYERPRFLLDIVMKNLDFNLGLGRIDQRKLNSLLQNERYKDMVSKSTYCNTGTTSVKFKTYKRIPEDFQYKVLEYEDLYCDEPEVIYTPDNLFKTQKKKKKEMNTFIVFGSSKTILSGKYDEDLKNNYLFFVNEVYNNLNVLQVKERTVDVKKFKRSIMKLLE